MLNAQINRERRSAVAWGRRFACYRRIVIAFAVLVCGFAATPVKAEEIDKEVMSDVYAGLADLTVLRDKIQQRYAYFVAGETHILNRNRLPQIRGTYMIRAADRKSKFEYIGNCAMGTLRSGTKESPYEQQVQGWYELVKDGFAIKARSGLPTRRDYKVKPDGITVRDFLDNDYIRIEHFDPFDDLVIRPSFITSEFENKDWIEKTYLKQAKLLSCERLAGQNIRSKWRWTIGDADDEIELIQSKALGYLPIEMKHRSLHKLYPKVFGHSRIEWKRHAASGEYLPCRLEAAIGAPLGDRVTELYFLIEWKVGDEIGDEVFDWNLPDNRLPFAKYFDIEFDAALPGGKIIPVPWKTPEGLFPDEKTGKGTVR